jgi:hypothetical protein
MKRELHLQSNDPRACRLACGFAPSARGKDGDRLVSGRAMA